MASRSAGNRMKLVNILADIHPVLRIFLIVALTLVAHFAVKGIRQFSQYLLMMKVDSKATYRSEPGPQISEACHHRHPPGQCGDVYDLLCGRWHDSARI